MNGHRPVAGDSSLLLGRACSFDAAVASIGNCRIRHDKHLQAAGIPITTVVHPRAWMRPFARLGGGTVVMARAVVVSRRANGTTLVGNHAAPLSRVSDPGTTSSLIHQ
jgi:hypothetical protein